MPDVLIRNINEETLNNLKKRAENNNRSLQAELKSLIELHAGQSKEDSLNMVKEIYERYKAEGRFFSDSVDDIREDRNR
tara:strand:+ start:9486 stop:9722 length:237 start_codon:yes stop_codon:yes gene_type:complete